MYFFFLDFLSSFVSTPFESSAFNQRSRRNERLLHADLQQQAASNKELRTPTICRQRTNDKKGCSPQRVSSKQATDEATISSIGIFTFLLYPSLTTATDTDLKAAPSGQHLATLPPTNDRRRQFFFWIFIIFLHLDAHLSTDCTSTSATGPNGTASSQQTATASKR